MNPARPPCLARVAWALGRMPRSSSCPFRASSMQAFECWTCGSPSGQGRRRTSSLCSHTPCQVSPALVTQAGRGRRRFKHTLGMRWSCAGRPCHGLCSCGWVASAVEVWHGRRQVMATGKGCGVGCVIATLRHCHAGLSVWVRLVTWWAMTAPPASRWQADSISAGRRR